MIEPAWSRRERLPAPQFDLATFGHLLDLFQSEFDHLICQADLPGSFVITEDPAAFRDALSEHSHATNIRLRGWTRRADAGTRLGELLLTDHRAEIRVDGYEDVERAVAFLGAVRDRARSARRPLSWLYSPWLILAGILAGALVAPGSLRSLAFQDWSAVVAAAVAGALAGLACTLTFLRIIQRIVPYAGVRGLGLRAGGRLDPAAREARNGEASQAAGRDPASAA